MKFIPCYALTGGGAGSLDAIDGAGLSDGDAGRVISDGVEFFYRLDASSGAAEASPTVISPDSNAGTKRWLLQGVRAASLQLATGATPTEFSTDGTMGGNSDAAVPTEKAVKTYVDNVGGLSASNLPGFLIRPVFEYKDTDEIYIGAGRYHHNGTAEQIVYWNSQLTYTASGLGNSTWYYLYLDDSAIVTHGSALLTATEFTHSSTAPTFSSAKGGYYSGNDRCIGYFLTDGSGNIKEFFHDGGLRLLFADSYEDRTLADLDATAEDVTLTIPAICTEASCTFRTYANGQAGTSYLYWKTTGQTSTFGHPCGLIAASSTSNTYDSQTVHTNSSQKISIWFSTGGLGQAELYTNGVFFPRGM